MSQGDHIYIYRYAFGCLPFEHHGIDCGDGTVIHYSERYITQDPMSLFANGNADGSGILVRKYEKSDPPCLVIQRAKKLLGENLYSIWHRNCEHFATWCMTGEAKSKQLEALALFIKNRDFSPTIIPGGYGISEYKSKF